MITDKHITEIKKGSKKSKKTGSKIEQDPFTPTQSFQQGDYKKVGSKRNGL